MSNTPSLSPLDSSYVLTREQTDRYKKDGHILLRNVASRQEIDLYRHRVQKIVLQSVARRDTQGRIEEYSSLFLQVTNVWRLDDTLRNFIFAKRFARIAAELMGVHGVRLYHDQALFKPAGGKATPWHQDQFYWPLETNHTITMWMPLIDVSQQMGTMSFASGSHQDGPLVDVSISEKSHELFEHLIVGRSFATESYELQAGDATFHSGWTVHSTHANSSSQVREVITIIYYADGTLLLEPDNEFRKADMQVFHPGQKPGELAATPLNPLLYP